jgi:hypothetical protein
MKRYWKRVPRKEEQEMHKTLTTQVPYLGAPRDRPNTEEDAAAFRPPSKKVHLVPTLEECLGVENLRRIREEEAAAFIAGICESAKKHDTGCNVMSSKTSNVGTDEENVENVKIGEDAASEQHQGNEEEKEATGPGDAGSLLGADVSAWQDQC